MSIKYSLLSSSSTDVLASATRNGAGRSAAPRTVPRPIGSWMLLGAGLALSALAAPEEAVAQGSLATAPPVFEAIDEHGVDLSHATLKKTLMSIRVGPEGPGGLGYNWTTASSYTSQQDVFGFVSQTTSTIYSVSVGGSTETFTLSGSLGSGSFTHNQGKGSTLTYSGGIFTFTRSDGAVALFSATPLSGGPAGFNYMVTSLTYPAGEKLTYHYVHHPYTDSWGTVWNYYDVRAVASSLGYQLRIGYTPYVSSPTRYHVSSVVAFNSLSETCDPDAASCSLSGTWPSLTYNISTGDITDSIGNWVRWANTATPGVAAITYPSGRQITYTYAGQEVWKVNDGKGEWSYSHPGRPYAMVTLKYRPDVVGPDQFQFDPPLRASPPSPREASSPATPMTAAGGSPLLPWAARLPSTATIRAETSLRPESNRQPRARLPIS